jgi:hypothetical protein
MVRIGSRSFQFLCRKRAARDDAKAASRKAVR